MKKLDERPQWLSSNERPLSDLPPIDVPEQGADRPGGRRRRRRLGRLGLAGPKRAPAPAQEPRHRDRVGPERWRSTPGASRRPLPSFCSPSAKTRRARASPATPQRVAEAYAEFFAGLDDDPRRRTSRDATGAHRRGGRTGELVLLRDIEFRSMCEHHLLPFVGVAHVAYIPASRSSASASCPRVVDTLARAPAAAGAADRGDRRRARRGLDPLGRARRARRPARLRHARGTAPGATARRSRSRAAAHSPTRAAARRDHRPLIGAAMP